MYHDMLYGRQCQRERLLDTIIQLYVFFDVNKCQTYDKEINICRTHSGVHEFYSGIQA